MKLQEVINTIENFMKESGYKQMVIRVESDDVICELMEEQKKIEQEVIGKVRGKFIQDVIDCISEYILQMEEKEKHYKEKESHLCAFIEQIKYNAGCEIKKEILRKIFGERENEKENN